MDMGLCSVECRFGNDDNIHGNAHSVTVKCVRKMNRATLR